MMDGMMTENIIKFPNQGRSPAQALELAADVKWQNVICLGFNESEDFELFSSEMPAERALWLLEWAKKWALNP